MNITAVSITLIICGTLIVISLFGGKDRGDKKMNNISFIEKFKKYNVNPNDIGFENIGWKYVFPNGYGASVINTGYGKELRII